MKRLLSLRNILILAFLIICLLNILRPISDPDFFWHIATGKWIINNRALPSQDPFSYTTPKELELRDISILKGYWLSQVIYYVSYLIGGWNGIIILRIFIALFIILFLIKRCEVQDRNIHYAAVLLSVFVILNFYPLDRPQVFSFLSFALLLYLIDTFRKGRASRLHLIGMPFLMVLWANMHPGYILGQLIILIYLISEVLKKRFSLSEDHMSPADLKRFSIISAVSVLSGFLNPLAYRTLIAFISFSSPETSYMRETILEYQSSIYAFFKLNDYIVFFYWVIAILTVLSIFYRLRKRHIDPAEIIMTAGLLYASFTEVRYMAFFLIWAVPLTSFIIMEFLSRERLRKAAVAGIVLIILLWNGYFTGDAIKNMRHFLDNRWISAYYPHAIVKFIKKNNINGNMYNHYDWGGYLIWELGPERKVFIDGRGLHSKVFATWKVLENAEVNPLIGGKPYWRAILDTYNIDYAIVPICYRSGYLYSLSLRLLDEKDWLPVLIIGNYMLFVRDITANREVIYKYSIPKETFIDDMIRNIDWVLQEGDSPVALMAKGELYLYKGDLSAAEESFRKALRLAPLNTMLRERLIYIEQRKKEVSK